MEAHSFYKNCSYQFDILENKGYKHTCVPKKS